MDAQINLKLRRSDRSTLLLRKHEEEKSHKRNHIREMLIQNFYRRFGLPGETKQTNEGYFESDRIIQDETNKFLSKNSHAINSKDLAIFERELATKLKWQRLKNEGSKSSVRVSVPMFKQGTTPNTAQKKSLYQLPDISASSTTLRKLRQYGPTSQSVSKLETAVPNKMLTKVDAYTNVYQGTQKTLEQGRSSSSLLISPKVDLARPETLPSERFQAQMHSVSTSKILPRILARKRDADVDDLPSQMSVDEWGEVQKYSKVLDSEMR